MKNLLQFAMVKLEHLLFIFTASVSYIKIQVKILKHLLIMNIAGDRNWVS